VWGEFQTHPTNNETSIGKKKTGMFADRFVYDDSHPPLCLRGCPPAELNSVRKYVKQYLHESSRDGRKDANALLECGLTAGEAAVFHIRDTNSMRRTVPVNHALDSWLVFLKESMQHHFDLKFDDHVQRMFDQHISVSLFQTKQMNKQLSVALKHFLSEIQLKSKGYTVQLKRVLEDVENKWSTMK
jgi:hypothetical protein